LESISRLTVSIVLFKKYGIGVKFVTSDDPAAFAAVIDEKTKAIYVESIGNPKYNVSPIGDIAKVCNAITLFCLQIDIHVIKVAHEHNVPLIVDNTFGMGGRHPRCHLRSISTHERGCQGT
jgi:O-acetylhomoserine/O-acetylserine sulfhydrylase